MLFAALAAILATLALAATKSVRVYNSAGLIKALKEATKGTEIHICAERVYK